MQLFPHTQRSADAEASGKPSMSVHSKFQMCAASGAFRISCLPVPGYRKTLRDDFLPLKCAHFMVAGTYKACLNKKLR